jgi:type I restriction enzyme M protein
MTHQLSLFQPPKSKAREALANDIWRACDILRRDDNCSGVIEYMEHLSWLLFLRFLDAPEEMWAKEAMQIGSPYRHILDEGMQWSAWARKGRKAEELLPFVHDELIP